jgi:paraquat-inducible protein B
MNDSPQVPAEATVRTPSRFSLIWLVPIVAAALAIYIGYEALASRGPLITITFPDGAGLAAGQTKLEHKSVALGTVQRVVLTNDYKQVIASVRIDKTATPLLTSHARFWVVRPRLSLPNPSGLQTLLSGSYIAVDPGLPGGHPERHFVGLDRPPGVRSDVPGQTFTLEAPRLGWVEEGAPVFYHDITVGQLLDYQEPGMDKPLIMRVFIKAPYDRYVRGATHFWNVSGISMNFGPSGVHMAVESMQALLAGGIEFANFGDAANSGAAPHGKIFRLYANFDDAQNAGFRDNIHYVSYFNESVAGLQTGSAVQLYGIRVGTVTGTQLELDPTTGQPHVRVTFDVQPERVFAPDQLPRTDPLDETRKLVALGMRARVDTGNLLTGQEVIGLDMVPNPPAANVAAQDGLIVWPSGSGGLQDLTNSVGEIVNKLNTLPLDQLGDRANDLLDSLRKLAATTNSDLKPVATELPRVARQLQTTLLETDRLLKSIQTGYGANSETQHTLQQLAVQATEAVRSIQQLTSYLDRHPGSIVWGR